MNPARFWLFIVHFREKADLWKKADDMEHEIKVKADDRWMEDGEVSHCLGCNAEFSFLLRKVCFDDKTVPFILENLLSFSFNWDYQVLSTYARWTLWGVGGYFGGSKLMFSEKWLSLRYFCCRRFRRHASKQHDETPKKLFYFIFSFYSILSIIVECVVASSVTAVPTTGFKLHIAGTYF